MKVDHPPGGVKSGPAPSANGHTEVPLVAPTPRDTAVRLLARGFWPVGVHSGQKRPIGKAWGATRATPATLNALYRRHAGAGVGVCLGPGRGPGGSWLLDVECDGPGGEDSRRRLFGGAEIASVGWMSARGPHLLLTADPDRVAELLKPLGHLEGTSVETKGSYHLPDFPGVEIRFGGVFPDGTVKQVHSAFAPTPGTDGKPREWNGVSEIAAAPEALYVALAAAAAPPTAEPAADLADEIERKRAAADAEREATSRRRPGPSAGGGDRGGMSLEERAARYLEKCDPAISGQQGHRKAFNVACHVGPGFDLDPEVFLGLLKRHWNHRCEPPWSDKELQHKVEDAYRKETRRGWLRDAPPKNGHRPAAGSGGRGAGSEGSDGPAKSRGRRFRLTDLGNGERLVHLHGDNLRYVHPWSKWLVWDGRRWAVDNTAAAARLAKRAIRSIYKQAAESEDDAERKELAQWAKASEAKGRVEAALWAAAREGGVPALPEELDLDPWLLNCPNGTVCLKTGNIQAHSRSDLITRLCPVEYDPAADAPLWYAFIDRIFAGKRDVIGYVQRLCGCALTGAVVEQILPILHGSGANGKSTLLNTLLAMLGDDYAMKAPQDLLMVKRGESHPTERAALFGKRLVVAIETGEGCRINEVLVKELTGGDPITARRMREDFWTFRPTHKVLLCTNHKPTVRGTDHAIWRRLQLVPFDVTIPKPEQDGHLPAKLLAELPGILAWCVRGCLEWQETGLRPPACVAEATDQYRQDEDILGAFISEHCVTGPEHRVKATPLYQRYRAWAEGANESVVNQRKFGQAMTERGFDRVKNVGIWYQGIDLRPEGRKDDE